MNVLESLKWRSATKKFDSSKKVSNEDLEKLIEAASLTATSGGFQPFKLVVVSSDEVKEKLVPVAYNQTQVGEASHVFVFALESNIDETMVDAYMKLASEVRNQPLESLEGYSQSMKAWIGSMDDNQRYAWARSQAYIALGTVMTAAAAMKIDSCPMEGFVPDQFEEILDLKSKNLQPVVILPIGYRSEEDVYSTLPKVRKSRENFVIEIN